MKIKFLLAVFIFIGLVSMPMSYWCIYTNGICYATWVSHIALSTTQPFYYFSLYAWPAILLTFFMKDSIFKSWLKFAKYFLPFAFLLVALTPAMPAPGTIIDLFPFYRVNAAELAGQVFSVTTLILIVWKYIAMWRSVRAQRIKSV